jgi:hypothetical protein
LRRYPRSGERLAAATLQLGLQRDELTREADALRRKLEEVEMWLAHSHRALESVMGSASWRIRALLRRLKRLLSGR